MGPFYYAPSSKSLKRPHKAAQEPQRPAILYQPQPLMIKLPQAPTNADRVALEALQGPRSAPRARSRPRSTAPEP